MLSLAIEGGNVEYFRDVLNKLNISYQPMNKIQ